MWYLFSVSLDRFSCCNVPSAEVRCSIRRASILPCTLSVIHVIHSVSIDLPCKVNGNQTENQPAEQYLEYGHSHIISKPVVHEFREKRHEAVNNTRQKLKVPRLLHCWQLIG